MIKLFLKSVPPELQENTAPSFSGILSSIEPDLIAGNSDNQYNSEAKRLDIFVADSRYDEIKRCASDKDCDLHLNVFSYPVKNSNSVKAINSLTKTEFHILRELATHDTLEKIADRNCRSFATIKRHVHNVYEKLNVNTRCQAVSAYLLFLLEYPEEA